MLRQSVARCPPAPAGGARRPHRRRTAAAASGVSLEAIAENAAQVAAARAAAGLPPVVGEGAAAASTAAAAATTELGAAVPGGDATITVAFTVAAVALGVVTLGVAYLSLASFIDSREEAKARKALEDAERSRAMQPAETKVPRRKKPKVATVTSRGGGKGFGG